MLHGSEILVGLGELYMIVRICNLVLKLRRMPIPVHNPPSQNYTHLEALFSFPPAVSDNLCVFLQDGRHPLQPAKGLCVQPHLRVGDGHILH